MARNGRRSPLVLCYHAVSDEWVHGLAIPRARFERQIMRISSIYPPLSAEQVLVSGRRGMHVTFDDAYANVADVLPFLRRLGVPVTIFACTSYADDGRPLGVPELAAEANSRPAELATMGWDVLRELAEDGVEVGSHTVSHPHLTGCSQTELARELTESRERLEDELRRPCRFVAYPYGDQDERVRAAAKAAGYAGAFAMSSDLSRADRFAIPRVGIWRGDHSLRAAAKIAVQHVRKRPVWPASGDDRDGYLSDAAP